MSVPIYENIKNLRTGSMCYLLLSDFKEADRSFREVQNEIPYCFKKVEKSDSFLDSVYPLKNITEPANGRSFKNEEEEIEKLFNLTQSMKISCPESDIDIRSSCSSVASSTRGKRNNRKIDALAQFDRYINDKIRGKQFPGCDKADYYCKRSISTVFPKRSQSVSYDSEKKLKQKPKIPEAKEKLVLGQSKINLTNVEMERNALLEKRGHPKEPPSCYTLCNYPRWIHCLFLKDQKAIGNAIVTGYGVPDLDPRAKVILAQGKAEEPKKIKKKVKKMKKNSISDSDIQPAKKIAKYKNLNEIKINSKELTMIDVTKNVRLDNQAVSEFGSEATSNSVVSVKNDNKNSRQNWTKKLPKIGLREKSTETLRASETQSFMSGCSWEELSKPKLKNRTSYRPIKPWEKKRLEDKILELKDRDERIRAEQAKNKKWSVCKEDEDYCNLRFRILLRQIEKNNIEYQGQEKKNSLQSNASGDENSIKEL